MFSNELRNRAQSVLEAYRRRGWMLATAESCTGGLVAACLTEISGSSDVVERGFVTYTNAAKSGLLGVPQATLHRYGAVSERVAELMAAGALARTPTQVAVAITGVAGPGGGSAEKPVGMVCFGLASIAASPRHVIHRFGGDRAAVREASVAVALDLLLAAAQEDQSQ